MATPAAADAACAAAERARAERAVAERAAAERAADPGDEDQARRDGEAHVDHVFQVCPFHPVTRWSQLDLL